MKEHYTHYTLSALQAAVDSEWGALSESARARRQADASPSFLEWVLESAKKEQALKMIHVDEVHTSFRFEHEPELKIEPGSRCQ